MADALRKTPQVVKILVIAVVVIVVVALVYLATGGGAKTGTIYFRMANSINPGDAVKVLGIGASYEYSFRDEKSNNMGSVIIQNSDCKA